MVLQLVSTGANKIQIQVRLISVFKPSVLHYTLCTNSNLPLAWLGCGRDYWVRVSPLFGLPVFRPAGVVVCLRLASEMDAEVLRRASGKVP